MEYSTNCSGSCAFSLLSFSFISLKAGYTILVLKVNIEKVIVSTSGSKLLPEDAVSTLVKELLPKAFLLTPNILEALLLLKTADKPVPNIRSIEDMKTVAIALHTLGPSCILLKGGHMPLMMDGQVAEEGKGELLVDVFWDGIDIKTIEKPYIDSRSTHGTGCSLAAAIACNLAKQIDPYVAVKEASRYITAAIQHAPGFGKGNGPLNHLHSSYMLPFAP